MHVRRDGLASADVVTSARIGNFITLVQEGSVLTGNHCFISGNFPVAKDCLGFKTKKRTFPSSSKESHTVTRKECKSAQLALFGAQQMLSNALRTFARAKSSLGFNHEWNGLNV